MSRRCTSVKLCRLLAAFRPARDQPLGGLSRRRGGRLGGMAPALSSLGFWAQAIRLGRVDASFGPPPRAVAGSRAIVDTEEAGLPGHCSPRSALELRRDSRRRPVPIVLCKNRTRLARNFVHYPGPPHSQIRSRFPANTDRRLGKASQPNTSEH